MLGVRQCALSPFPACRRRSASTERSRDFLWLNSSAAASMQRHSTVDTSTTCAELTLSMVADLGTKSLSTKQFVFLRDVMNGYALVRASKAGKKPEVTCAAVINFDALMAAALTLLSFPSPLATGGHLVYTQCPTACNGPQRQPTTTSSRRSVEMWQLAISGCL